MSLSLASSPYGAMFTLSTFLVDLPPLIGPSNVRDTFWLTPKTLLPCPPSVFTFPYALAWYFANLISSPILNPFSIEPIGSSLKFLTAFLMVSNPLAALAILEIVSFA